MNYAVLFGVCPQNMKLDKEEISEKLESHTRERPKAAKLSELLFFFNLRKLF